MYKTVLIECWPDIIKLDIGWSGSLFRGQSNAGWEPETSLRRAFIRERKRYPDNLIATSVDEDAYTLNEYYFVKEFRRRAHHYLTELPFKDDYVAWLAVMQHHGTPTRLLDFTYSFYIALFFALYDATADSAVWAIDDLAIRRSGSRLANSNGGLREAQLLVQHDFANQYLSKCFDEAKGGEDLGAKLGVLMLEPEKQNLRLGIQQGVLLMPMDLTRTFLDNLNKNLAVNSESKSTNVTKYVIPLAMRDEALAHLHRMNITAETLFPGIDGYARSIEHKIWY